MQLAKIHDARRNYCIASAPTDRPPTIVRRVHGTEPRQGGGAGKKHRKARNVGRLNRRQE